MLAAASSVVHAAPVSRPRSELERLRLLMLWLTGATGALVFIEPSPYEIVSFLTIALFAISGLALRAALMPLAILLILINIGYTISASSLFDQTNVLTWVLTSWYLALTSVFFAAMLNANTEARLNALMRGCVIAAVIAALVGIAGYFRLIPGSSELLLLYDRARSTFKDPNVFGAFMVLPMLLALQQVISGRFWQAARYTALLALFAAGTLLSFSRGAWGQTVLTAALMLALSFITTASPNRRLRIVLIAVASIAVMALFLATLLSIDAIANLFKQRASLDQSYDAGETGRFGRHILGAVLALDVPFGIGPLQFGRSYFPEDPHNSYLNAFMSGGWLSGACYPALVLTTLVYGARPLFVATPWQSTTIVVYCAYVGAVAESIIIDTDHWRHGFLLLGVLWGLIMATRAHVGQAETRSLRLQTA
jgi:hypothetical protein